MIQLQQRASRNNKILGIYGTVENPNYQLAKLFLKISKDKKYIDSKTIFVTLNFGKNEDVNRIRAFIQETKHDIMCFIKIPINLKYTNDERLALWTITKTIESIRKYRKDEGNAVKSGDNILVNELYRMQRSLNDISILIDKKSYQITKEDCKLASLASEIPCISKHKVKASSHNFIHK